MNYTIPDIILQKEPKNESSHGLRTVFVVPNESNRQTSFIPLRLEFWGNPEDPKTYLLVNPWVSISLHSRVSNQISLVEQGLPLPVSLGHFQNGSGGVLQGNLLVWETKAHLTNQLCAMMERIADPQFGATLKVDWGVTMFDLTQPRNASVETWYRNIRIMPDKWIEFSSLWK